MKAFETMLTRYEGARIHCLRMANYHPDSREVCHQTLARVPTSTSTEVFLAGLLDDMALAMKQALNEQGAAKIEPAFNIVLDKNLPKDVAVFKIDGKEVGRITAIRQDGEPS